MRDPAYLTRADPNRIIDGLHRELSESEQARRNLRVEVATLRERLRIERAAARRRQPRQARLAIGGGR